MSDALLSSVIMVLALAMFLSDRIRPDAVALIVLLLAWVTGLVTLEEALAGFGSPAVLIVAAVLVVGRAVEYTGAAQAMTGLFVPKVRFASIRLGGVLLMGAILSAFMNNIAALAITMPIALTVAREHKLPNGAVLMPLAFATILGGMTTLIGTPPNLIVSGFRAQSGLQGFAMFDFTYVGLAVAGAGIVFIVLLGWRLVPARKQAEEPGFDTGTYLTEARLTEKSKAVNKTLREAEQMIEEADVQTYPFSGEFDFCFSRFGTQFFENPVAALRNMRTSLKPGGTMTMIVWRDIADNPWLGLPKSVIMEFLPPPGDDARSRILAGLNRRRR